MEKKMFWRQGDVGIIQVGAIPKSAKQVKHDGVLAYGEVTGHKHQLVGGQVRYFRNDEEPNKLYFKVESRFVNLNHRKGSVPTVKREESSRKRWFSLPDLSGITRRRRAATEEEGHFTHELPEGTYALIHQKEFDWVTETTRLVED